MTTENRESRNNHKAYGGQAGMHIKVVHFIFAPFWRWSNGGASSTVLRIWRGRDESTHSEKTKLSCSHSAVARGLRRAGYKNVKGGDVPHELTLDNKNRRIDCATELLTKRRTFAWLERLITGDESWVLYETPKVTRYWIPSSSDPPCRARAEAHQRKLLLCVWWSVRGIEYWEVLPEGITVTAELYRRQLGCLKEKLDSDTYWSGRVIFQHDNARPHVANNTRLFLKECGWEVICHPPYSPDLAPSDYHLFRSLKNHIAGKKFRNEEDVKTAVNTFFETKPASFYRDGIFDLPNRWRKVIQSDAQQSENRAKDEVFDLKFDDFSYE
ncbi:hypothetical protein Q1695_000485 [Nippostrongylus brasiliensis]|nr:hypothetical protein Q1695_000485 [Nippostrongylus brasiliensis]